MVMKSEGDGDTEQVQAKLQDRGFCCLGMGQFAGIWVLPVESIWPMEQRPCAQQLAEAQQLAPRRRRVTQLKEGNPASEKEASKIQA